MKHLSRSAYPVLAGGPGRVVVGGGGANRLQQTMWNLLSNDSVASACEALAAFSARRRTSS
jgi:hypothetical protein